MKKNVIFGIISIIVLISAIVGGILLVNQNQDFREKAAPATSIFISPATQTKNPSDNFNLTVVMDTSSNLVTGVDVRLNFNPNLVEITSLQKGTDLTNFDSVITNDFNNTSGTIAYTIFTIDKTKAVTGSGVQVLTINGKIKSNASGTATFTFNSSTTASGVNEGQNILVGMTAGSIIVSGQQTTSSPSQVASPSSTATSTSINNNSSSNPTATASSKSTSTAVSTTKATNTPISEKTSVSATATPFPVPVTGNANTTILGLGFGTVVVIVSLFFAF